MSKMQFIKERDYNNPFDVSRVSVEVHENYLPKVLTGFVDFLLASGYSEACIEKYIHVDKAEADILNDPTKEEL